MNEENHAESSFDRHHMFIITNERQTDGRVAPTAARSTQRVTEASQATSSKVAAAAAW